MNSFPGINNETNETDCNPEDNKLKLQLKDYDYHMEGQLLSEKNNVLFCAQ
jgi:hypothetical protein